ncbi:MAG: lactonase family protein [Aristaeellaceae bacterium]
MEAILFAGTYTEPMLFGTGEVFQGKGEGVYLCAFDGRSVDVRTVIPAVNPSFVCVDEKHRRLFAVNETGRWQGEEGGGVSQWRYDGQGRFTPEGSWCTGGADPCHVALSPDGRWLAAANYTGGSLAVFPRDAEGRILPERRLLRHAGRGVHPARQEGPHVHSALFDGRGRLFAADLGCDRLACYRCGEDVAPEPAGDLTAAPGSGPRCGEYSADGRHLYVIHELDGTVVHYDCTGGSPARRESVSTLPEGYAGANTAADVHLTPDGRCLYATNRGHDSIAMFRVTEGGGLTLLGHQGCGGRTPRNFAIDPSGRYLLVGNQDTDNIAIFAIGEDGRLRQTGDVPFPSPVCIRFVGG